jgi:hypothetical protein
MDRYGSGMFSEVGSGSGPKPGRIRNIALHPFFFFFFFFASPLEWTSGSVPRGSGNTNPLN